jgi:predicted lipoprotein with Yx(FWY)xxD motif
MRRIHRGRLVRTPRSLRTTRPKRGRPATRAASLATCTAMCTAVLASCGGGDYIGGSSVTTSASVTSGTVDVKSVKGYGKVLVTSTGVSLYLLTSDPSGGSSCVGSCAIVWPPLISNGKLKAGPGVNPSLLSSFSRNGGKQVLYNNHALYTYEEDTGPGMVTGQGVETYGGIWWLVSPSGHAITGAAAAPA